VRALPSRCQRTHLSRCLSLMIKFSSGSSMPSNEVFEELFRRPPASGHPSDRRQPKPGKITRKGGRRPSRVTRSALAGDLPRFHTGAPGGWPALAARAPGADRYGAAPVRRAAGTTRAPTPPWPGGPKSGRRRPGAQLSPQRPRPMTGGSCAAPRSAPSARGAYQQRWPAGARRAPRALEAVEKVLTTRQVGQGRWGRWKASKVGSCPGARGGTTVANAEVSRGIRVNRVSLRIAHLVPTD
jgi:hypothetical protein